MVLSATMKFYDMNYNEFASLTGTNFSTSTGVFLYDNRSDAGNGTWTDTSGTLVMNYGTSAGLIMSDFFINNTNIKTGYIEAWTGTAYAVAASFTNIATTGIHLNFTTITQVSQIQLTFDGTQNNQSAYAGEIISTRLKFSLTNNPNTYVPQISPVAAVKTTWDGKLVWNERSAFDGVFSANIGWTWLQGAASTATDDVQNMTSLARRRNVFLFWPNAGNAHMNMYTWRGEDMFKCQIIDTVTYEFSNNALDNFINTSFLIQEVK